MAMPSSVRRVGVAGVVLLLPPLLAIGLATPVAQDKPVAAAHRVSKITGPDVKSAAEVSVAINPTNPDHLVAVSIQYGKPGTTNFSYASTDGGRTWKQADLPNPRKLVQGDDVVTFTADGLAVRTYIAFRGNRGERPAQADSGILIRTSRDGLTWGAPAAAVEHINTSRPFEDKPWIKADTVKGSQHRGNLYVAWTKFDVYGSKKPEDKSHIYFSRSKDGGKTFMVPLRISEKPGNCVDDSNTVEGACPAVGPKGEVHVVWAGPQGLVFTTSKDGGFQFGKNHYLGELAGWDFAVAGLGRANGLPSCGVDVSGGKDRGSIYVCWGDRRNGDPDVFLMASRDGGATWSKPLRVNDNALKNGKEQFFPWLVVDPADGSLNIAFYDRRGLDGANTGLTLARSVDGGRMFVNHKVEQPPFDCPKKGKFFGDYLGIDAVGGRVAVAYMHYVEGNNVALSAAVFDFEPGTQKARVAKQGDKEK